MALFLKLLMNLFFWASIAVIIVLAALIPRETTFERIGTIDHMAWDFSWKAYEENIVNYYRDVKENKSLGTTQFKIPVETELQHYGLRSLKILIPAFILSIILGIIKGVYDYTYQKGPLKILGKFTTWFGQSVPDFFIIFSVQTFLFFLMTQGLIKIDMYGDEQWYNIIMPILFLSMYPVSLIAKYTAEALEEEEQKDYIRTALSKGVPRRMIIWKHALRNCYPKLLLHFMPVVMTLLSAMLVVEFLTMYRGIGTRLLSVLAIQTKMLPGQPLPIDPGAFIGFSLLILFALLIVQWIDSILTHFLTKHKEEGVS